MTTLARQGETDAVAAERAPAPPGQNPGAVRRRVFYLLDSLHIGGTETQAVELARRLDPARYEVTLGCLSTQGPLREKLAGSAVHIEEFRPKGGIDSVGGLYQLLRLAAFLRRGRFDVVHTHDLWSNLMGVPAARLARVPAIISSRRDLGHLDWYEGGRRVWLRRIQNLSNVVLANATPIRDALIAEDGFAPEKLRVIHNGVEVERFTRVVVDREQTLPGCGGKKLVVLVGNMHSDIKGHPWVIAAAPKIVAQVPEVCIVFAGDGAQRAQLEQQVGDLGLKDHFLFLGRRNDIPEILRCCDIGLLPSKAEGLPNAILEYMCAGLPTVATAVGGNVEVVQEAETGLLVPAQNADALAAAILKLLRDPAMASRMGESAQVYVATNFSFERLIREVDELYSELLRTKN